MTLRKNFFKFSPDALLIAIILSSVALYAFFSTGCQRNGYSKVNDSTKVDTVALRKQDSVKRITEIIKSDTFPVIKYSKIQIKTNDQLRKILNKFSNDTTTFDKSRIIKTLNRKELRFIRVGDSIVVPDTAIRDIRTYSIFPVIYNEAWDIPKIIIVSNKYQSYACYEKGHLVRFAAANTGKETSQTYPGRYSLVWKARTKRSSIDSNWILPFVFNFHHEAGNAFHQFDMPGRPVSHSCIRQFMEDAKWLFYWGEGLKKDSSHNYIPMSGVPVIIIDNFDYSRKRFGPWLDLQTNKDTVISLPKNPLGVEEALIPIVQIPKESRGSLRNRSRYLYAEDTLRARGIIRPQVVLHESVNFNKLRRIQKAQKAKEEKLKKEQNDKQEKKLGSPTSFLDGVDMKNYLAIMIKARSGGD
jgi:hypothetical protein